MVQQTINDLENKTLWVEVKGDLELVGTEDSFATVEVKREQDLSVHASADRITLVCESDLEMRAPAGASVRIIKVHGDAAVRFWTGPLEIDGVGGDLALEQIAAITVQSVGGDCSVLGASGPVQVGSVGSDFSGKGLMSDVAVNQVGSDFQLMDAAGNVTTAAGSDIRLSVSQTSGQRIVLRAGSDVRVDLPTDPDVSLRVVSGAQSVSVRLGESRKNYDTGLLETTFGSGGTYLEVVAGSDVIISDGGDRGSEESGKRTKWEERIARKTEKALRKAEHQLARAERQATHASRRGQEAVRRAEERVQAAMRRLEARRQGGGSFSFESNNVAGFAHDQSFTDEPAGATEEERMLILQMVQEKKITVEEADRLLAVLEGHQD